MIRGTGVPRINRITRIDHVTQRANPEKGQKVPMAALRLGSGCEGSGREGWADGNALVEVFDEGS